MVGIVEYVIIKDGSSIDSLSDEEKVLLLEYVLNKAKNITIGVLYHMFLEMPDKYLNAVISFTSKKRIIYEVLLDDVYYNKHIGKFTKEAQEEIMDDLIIKLEEELGKVDWKKGIMEGLR